MRRERQNGDEELRGGGRQRMITVMQESYGVPEAGAWVRVEAEVCLHK